MEYKEWLDYITHTKDYNYYESIIKYRHLILAETDKDFQVAKKLNLSQSKYSIIKQMLIAMYRKGI